MIGGGVSGTLRTVDAADVERSGRGRRSAVVVNPSKLEDVAGLRRTVTAALAADGWPEPAWYETTPEDPGAGQATRAVEDGADVVLACGGDGTVMACVGALAGTDAALAVLPAGTGNLLAANLGLPLDPTAGVRVVTALGRRRIDVGVVEGHCFAVMAGMGFDADLLADASESLKARVGVAAYVWSALQHLRDRPMRVQVRLDDGVPFRRRARTVLVGNVGRLQGGIRLLVDAEPDDGLLDVAVIRAETPGQWLALASGVLRGRGRVPSMEVFRARSVTVESDREQPRELDGDLIAPGRSLGVTLRPSALLLCVPQPEESPDLAEGAPRR